MIWTECVHVKVNKFMLMCVCVCVLLQVNGTLLALPAMTYAATVKALMLGPGARLTQLCTSANKMT